MTEQELAAAQARADAATAGPWVHYAHELPGEDGRPVWDVDCNPPDVLSVARVFRGYGGPGETEANAAFIAHARADVPALVAEVRLLRRVVQDQQKESGLYDAGYAVGWRAAMETAVRVAADYGDQDRGMEVSEFLATYGPGTLDEVFARMAGDGLRPPTDGE